MVKGDRIFQKWPPTTTIAVQAILEAKQAGGEGGSVLPVARFSLVGFKFLIFQNINTVITRFWEAQPCWTLTGLQRL